MLKIEQKLFDFSRKKVTESIPEHLFCHIE